MIKKNYKIPEWLNPDEITLPMAERLIAYKKENIRRMFRKTKQ